MPNDRSVLDLPYQTTAADNDSVVADINNAVSRIKITTLKKIIGQWSEIDNKPFTSLNVNHFSSANSVLSISNDIVSNLHTHTNKTCIDKLSEDNEGNLLYDGSPIKTSLAFDDISDDFTVTNDELCISPEIKDDFHNHGNKNIIDKFSETNGTLLYDGEEVSFGSTSKVDLTCTALATNWQGNAAPYSQTITVNGLTSSINPIIDVVISNDTSIGLLEEDAWGCITKAITGNNTLTLYCYKNKPDVNLNLIIGVV